MWNWSEWWTFIKGIFKGILWGLGAAVALLLYGIFAGAWNCFCNFFSCDLILPEVNDDIILVFGFFIAFAISVIVGIIKAIGECRDRRDEELTVREQNFNKEVCTRVRELAHSSENLLSEIQQHAQNIQFCGGSYRSNIDAKIQENLQVHDRTLDRYQRYTNVKEEGES